MAFTEEDSGVIAVVIPFEQKDTGEPAEIVWVYDPETGTVVVVLANGWLECLFCNAACWGAYIGAVALCVWGGFITYGTVWVACSLLLTYGLDYWSYICELACYYDCK